MGTTLAELLIKVDVDADGVSVGVHNAADDVDDALDRMEDRAEKSNGRMSKLFGNMFGKSSTDGMNDRAAGVGRSFMQFFAKELSIVGKPVAVTAATAFSAQFLASAASGLASGAANLGHGLAAGAALLPAGIIAAGLAVGTLKVALSGMGAALSAGLSGDTEAFNEALKGMTPAAREVAREIVGLKGRLDGLKATVQENFFSQFAGQVRPLADQYLPAIERTMGGIARAFGRGVDGTIWFLALPETASRVDAGLLNVEAAVTNVTKGMSNLVQAFMPLFTVGASFLPGLTAGFGGATNSLAEFMLQAERTGALRSFIQGGIDSIRQLVDTGRQLGRIFVDLGAVVSTVFAGFRLPEGSILDTLERGAESMRRFVESAEGSEVVGQGMRAIGTIASSFIGTLQRVAGTLGRVFGPIMPEILDFIGALAELKMAVIDTGLDALEPVLMALGAVLGAVVLPALTALATWLADNQPVLQGIGIAILTFMIPAFIAWAISAGQAAIATLLLWAPLILIGVAIAALAALVIIHFDTIKNAIMTAFDWVKDNWPLLLAILTGPIGIAVLLITRNWDSIKAGAVAAKDGIVSAFNSVVSFVTGLPGRIARAASGMWNGITDAFRSAINSIIRMWNGISFPSITIGGGDPLGSFGPSLPEVTIGGWELPNIPLLAKGGILTRPTLMMGGEAGTEAVLPLGPFWSRLEDGFNKVVTAVDRLVDWLDSHVGWRLSFIKAGIETLIKLQFAGARNLMVFEDLSTRFAAGRGRFVPGLADGGIVKATPGGIDATIAEGGQDEAVIPLPRGMRSLNSFGGGGTVVVNVHGSVIGGRDLARLVSDELRRGGYGGFR